MRKKILIAFATLGAYWAPPVVDPQTAAPAGGEVPLPQSMPFQPRAVVHQGMPSVVTKDRFDGSFDITRLHDSRKYKLVFPATIETAQEFILYKKETHDEHMATKRCALVSGFRVVFPFNSFYRDDITFTLRALQEDEDFDHIMAQITQFASTMRQKMIIGEDEPDKEPTWYGSGFIRQNLSDVLDSLVKNTPCITNFRCATISMKFPSS